MRATQIGANFSGPQHDSPRETALALRASQTPARYRSTAEGTAAEVTWSHPGVLASSSPQQARRRRCRRRTAPRNGRQESRVFPTSHRPLRALATVSFLLLLPGCTDANGPTAPGIPSAALAVSRTTSYVALTRVVSLRAPASATAVITPDGGVLALPAAGLRVTFAAGAVAAPVSITVRTASIGRIAYDFAPHGLVFAAPVRVEQAIRSEVAAGLTAGLVATYLAADYTDRRDGGYTADEVLPLLPGA